MPAVNRVIVAGYLTQDPEVREVGNGRAVADMRLAITESFRDREGNKRETTCFTDVVAWGRQAEACGKALHKGAPVLVEGRLQFDEWQTESGDKRSKLRVRADCVHFLAPRTAADTPDAERTDGWTK